MQKHGNCCFVLPAPTLSFFYFPMLQMCLLDRMPRSCDPLGASGRQGGSVGTKDKENAAGKGCVCNNCAEETLQNPAKSVTA
eukprot:scaffold26819_cov16-Tisochrysis_lutea.AAC.1